MLVDINPINITSESFIQQLRSSGKHIKHWGFTTFENLKAKTQNLQNQLSFINNQSGDFSNDAVIQDLERQFDHLLGLDEAYWKQRSRSDWHKGGARNTKFFHHKASAQKRNNYIKGIMSPKQTWVTSEAQVQSIFKDYYQSFFTTFSTSPHCIDNPNV